MSGRDWALPVVTPGVKPPNVIFTSSAGVVLCHGPPRQRRPRGRCKQVQGGVPGGGRHTAPKASRWQGLGAWASALCSVVALQFLLGGVAAPVHGGQGHPLLVQSSHTWSEVLSWFCHVLPSPCSHTAPSATVPFGILPLSHQVMYCRNPYRAALHTGQSRTHRPPHPARHGPPHVCGVRASKDSNDQHTV